MREEIRKLGLKSSIMKSRLKANWMGNGTNVKFCIQTVIVHIIFAF